MFCKALRIPLGSLYQTPVSTKHFKYEPFLFFIMGVGIKLQREKISARIMLAQGFNFGVSVQCCKGASHTLSIVISCYKHLSLRVDEGEAKGRLF